LACGAKGNRLPRLMKRRPTARIFLAVGFYMPHGSRKSENGREIGIAPILCAKGNRLPRLMKKKTDGKDLPCGRFFICRMARAKVKMGAKLELRPFYVQKKAAAVIIYPVCAIGFSRSARLGFPKQDRKTFLSKSISKKEKKTKKN